MNAEIRRAIDGLKGLNAYQLAGYAECGHPDSLESDGANMLTLVRDELVELMERNADEHESLEDFAEWLNDSADDDGELHEIADGAPSIYNYTRMLQLTDLAAWQEDISHLTGGDEDMITLAGYALYEVARNLIAGLINELEA